MCVDRFPKLAMTGIRFSRRHVARSTTVGRPVQRSFRWFPVLNLVKALSFEKPGIMTRLIWNKQANSLQRIDDSS
jgi:hypothetical protein